jgi:hypothetical protein
VGEDGTNRGVYSLPTFTFSLVSLLAHHHPFLSRVGLPNWKQRHRQRGKQGKRKQGGLVLSLFLLLFLRLLIEQLVGNFCLREKRRRQAGKGCSFWALILSVMWEARPACVLLVVGSLFSSLKSALATLSLLLALSLTSNFLITCIFWGLSFELLILVLPKDFSVLMKQPPIM